MPIGQRLIVTTRRYCGITSRLTARRCRGFTGHRPRPSAHPQARRRRIKALLLTYYIIFCLVKYMF